MLSSHSARSGGIRASGGTPTTRKLHMAVAALKIHCPATTHKCDESSFAGSAVHLRRLHGELRHHSPCARQRRRRMFTTHALRSVSIIAEESDCPLSLHGAAWWLFQCFLQVHSTCATRTTKPRSEAHRLQSGTGSCSAAARCHQGICCERRCSRDAINDARKTACSTRLATHLPPSSAARRGAASVARRAAKRMAGSSRQTASM
jgi:hypothetical protein